MSIFHKKIKVPKEIYYSSIKHIAFIMDGNDKWAKKHNLSMLSTYQESYKKIKEVVFLCQKYHISYMSLLVLSIDDVNRFKDDANYQLSLLKKFLKDDLYELNARGIKIVTSGDLSKISLDVKEVIDEAILKTKHNEELVLNLCINYSGKDEVIRGIKRLSQDIKDNKVNPSSIEENTLLKYMDTGLLPSIDCLVRSTSDMSLSNYMLWSLVNAKIIFVDKYWLDFNEETFIDVLDKYATSKK